MTEEKNISQPIMVEGLEEDIRVLKIYLEEDDIKPLLTALEGLKDEPESEAAYQQMLDAFNELGFRQGAVLTYAHYLKSLVSKHVTGKGLE